MLQFVPWRAFAYETLRAGHLPLWNPLAGMGAPLLANYQTGLLYPPNWLYFCLAAIGGTPALAWGQGWLAAAHLAWAGVGMAWLVRRLGLGRLAQTIGGLAFGLSGYLVARAGFLSINAASAWMPWVLLTLTPGLGLAGQDRSADRKSQAEDFLLLVVSLGMLLLAGHAQTAWYTLLLALGWSAAMVWVRGRGERWQERGYAETGTGVGTESKPDSSHRQSFSAGLAGIGKAWLRLGVGIAAGTLLAAAQLLPTAEYLSVSQRASAVDYELAMTYSFWPWRLVTLFVPSLFGSPVSGDYWGYGNYWEDAIYIGLLPVILAMGALFTAAFAHLRRRQNADSAQRFWIWSRLVAFLAGLLLVTLILALGKNTPVFPWLYRYVPTFSLFQAPTRYMLWAVFGLALLAALGAQSWRRPHGRALYWTRLGTAGAAAITLGAGLAWLLIGRTAMQVNLASIRAMALSGAIGVGVGLLALAAPGQQQEDSQLPKTGWWTLAVVVVLALDLVSAGWGLNPATGVEVYANLVTGMERTGDLATSSRLYLPTVDEDRLKFERFFRFDRFDASQDWRQVRAVQLPNTFMLAGIASVNNFDPLLPGRYARWMEILEQAPEETRQGMLNLMSVNLVETMDESQPDGVHFNRRTTLPRLRWLPCALPAVDGEAALAQLITAIDDQTLVVESVDVEIDPACDPGASGTVQLVAENPNRIEVRTQALTSGYFLLADSWYPGWQAWVDGRPAPVNRANYLFQAVPVPAGEHHVVVAYRPSWFYLGAGLSTLSWLGLFAGLIWIGRREKRHRNQQV